MRKICGNNLVSYVIPTAVIGLVLVVALNKLISDGTFLKNIEATLFGKKVDGELKIHSIGATDSKLDAGDLGGTPDTPQMKCSLGVCTIDFGNYILTGIPEEISDISSAGRGGELTDSYAYLLEQLAEQLKEDNPAQSDILKRLAEKARKMADIEIYSDNKMTQMNNFQKEMSQTTGNTFDQVATVLNTIDPNNLQKDDLQKILASANFMKKAGIITQEQLEGITIATLSVVKDYPDLQPWQENFLDSIINTPNQITSLYDDAMDNLTDDDQTVILSKNKNLYNLTTNKIDFIVGSVDSSSTYGPGKEFNNILTNELPDAGFSQDILDLVNYVGSQIQTTADSIEQVETPISGPIVSVSLEIPPDAAINTNIAASIIENAA